MIDDKIVNLDSWSSKGGISIFFNIKYPMISDLSCLIEGFDKIKKERLVFMH